METNRNPVTDRASVEMIGKLRFSGWKPGRGEDRELPKFGVSFFLVMTILYAGMLVIGRLAIDAGNRGDWRLGNALVYTVMAILFSPMLFLPIWSVRKRKALDEASLPLPPIGIEKASLPVYVAVESSSRMAGTPGWLFVNRERLMFRGEEFDFELSPEDFVSTDGLAAQLLKAGVGAKLRVPDKLPPMSLRLKAGYRVDRHLKDDASLSERLAADLDAWQFRTGYGGLGLYPPLTPKPTIPITVGTVLKIGLAGLLFGAFLGAIPMVLPILPHLDAIKLFLVGFVSVIFMFAAIWFTNSMERRSVAAKVDRYRRTLVE